MDAIKETAHKAVDAAAAKVEETKREVCCRGSVLVSLM
jgi:hypothetical protein